ncbi:hypothetical protein TWF225_001981 [Orbilia oligospora]|nr:hypothetical protein TWF225_001981 [Orbilia oligospora]KAF3165054.1 hypothetical protein TWF751_009423 [Orbilia oligospora]KAF3239669.1 hypothetical protein TWF217_001221 [Orbilia oligospora]KAF3261272.1 hypothetical protein TWF128_003060 [Orbilia oligospora]KAF3281781.1 hypothetical protein TWF132_011103 [Orbilia oligospora]
MNVSGLHVTTRGVLDGSDIGTGSSSSLSSVQTLPSVSDSSLTAPDEIEERVCDTLAFEERYGICKNRYRRHEEEILESRQKYRNVPKYENKTNILKHHHYLFPPQKYLDQNHQQPPGDSFREQRAATSMRYDAYNQNSVLLAPPLMEAQHHQNTHYRPHVQQLHYPGHENTGHPNDYFSYPSETVNIKERRFPQSNLKSTKSAPRFRGGRQVRFELQTVDEDGPIPCNPVDCPMARLTLEDARLLHPVHLHEVQEAFLDPAYQQDTTTPPHETSYDKRSTQPYHARTSSKLSSRSISIGNSSPARPCLGSVNTGTPEGSLRSSGAIPSRFAYRAPTRPPPDIAEVEGDNTFASRGNYGNLHPSTTGLELSPSSPSFYSPSSQNSGDRPRNAAYDRARERDGSLEAPDLAPDFTPKKSKEILKKLLGGRTSRQPETGMFHFTQKFESGYSVRSIHLESRKEWAFVAVSPDSKTIVGVCDRECFMTYSMEVSGIKPLVYGEFDGEPLGIAVSNSHLAILTLTKLQVFNHHNSKKVYEWASDKSVATDNFTSIAFANSGLELCSALTNGTIQFHYIPAEDQDFDPDEVTFRRGDPRMDINLSSGDYAFTMSFSGNDTRFACGTQKRMLMVYEHRGPAAWELLNKFKFNDWEPGTHRRISGAIFCPDERFLFATTTSGRPSAYMRCIDSNKHSNCSQSTSYALPITKKGVTRSAMSPNGKAVALIDGDGTVYKCDFGAGSVLSDKQEFTKLPGTLIPARACWISWTSLGDLLLLDKKGHLKIYELSGAGRSPR